MEKTLNEEKLEKVTGGVTLPGQSDSLERLQNGLNINRNPDDAAGLSISERMRGQLGGLDEAATNSQDGIGLVNVDQEQIRREQQEALRKLRDEALQAQRDALGL